MVSPTGSGKTVMFKYIVESAAEKGKRSCILVHRKELRNQASRKLAVDHGVIAAGVTPRPSALIQVANVQTLVNRVSRAPFNRPEFAPDLIVIDEAHHAVASTYTKILEAYPDARILGVTATPCRADGRGLSEIFDDLILGPTVQELIDGGHLSPVEVYAPSTIDVRGLHTVAGDYNKKELEEASDKPTITGDAIDHYRRLAGGKPAIAFCVSVAHSEHVADAFTAAGYRAKSVSGMTPPDERDKAIEDLGNGGLDLLSMCDLANEGLDVPVVEVGIMLRPTNSLGLCRQQMGRVLRPAPGKDRAIILDHAGNCLRHGLPTTEVEWSLEGVVRRPKKKGEPDTAEEQVSYCPACYHIFTKASRCPRCGEVLASPRAVEEVAGELQKLDEAAFKRMQKRQVQRTRRLEDLIELAYSRGYSNPVKWATAIYEARGGKVVVGNGAAELMGIAQ